MNYNNDYDDDISFKRPEEEEDDISFKRPEEDEDFNYKPRVTSYLNSEKGFNEVQALVHYRLDLLTNPSLIKKKKLASALKKSLAKDAQNHPEQENFKVIANNYIEKLIFKQENELEEISELTDEDLTYDWVCSKLGLAAGDSIIIAAEAGSGKSYLAIYLMLCVMYNLPIFGKFYIQKPGSTLYINYDASKKSIQIPKYRLQNGMFGNDKTHNKFYTIQPNFKLSDGNSAEEQLTKWCSDKSLCIIDSLRSSYEGDENNSDEVQKVIRLANRVSEKTGCVIMFLAHTGKRDKASVRGSSAAKDAAGEVWNLNRDKKTNQNTITFDKTRLLDNPEPIYYTWRDSGEINPLFEKSNGVVMSLIDICETVDAENIEDTLVEKLSATPNKEMSQEDFFNLISKRKSEKIKIKDDMIAKNLIIQYKLTGSKKAWIKLV